jgi:hypothetical protein
MRSVLRVAAVIIAIPIGAVFGFFGAGLLYAFIFWLQGTRVYDKVDLKGLFIAGMGAVVSGTLLPWCVWRCIYPDRLPENGKVSKLGLLLVILGCVGDCIGILGVTWRAVPWIAVSTAVILIGLNQWARVGKEGS